MRRRALARPLCCLLLAGACAAPLLHAQKGYSQKDNEHPGKLSEDARIALLRGLTAEYAKVRVFIPRNRRAVRLNSDGTYDKAAWTQAGVEWGPVAKVGDVVQITHVEIEERRILFEINHGFKPKGKWYQRVEVGGGIGGTRPINPDPTKSFGTTIALEWDDPIPAEITPTQVKRILQPVLDFEKRNGSDDYFASLPPEVQQAIKAKRAAVGMTREQVLMAMGPPRDKIRETVDGLETEDWIYGLPPGRITFVTFANSKVIKVKDSYAGLGGSTAPPLRPVE
jgi:hypothetical protein